MKLIFLTIAEPGYSRSWVYYEILRRSGYDVEFRRIPVKKVVKSLRLLRDKNSRESLYIVMSPSHYLTIFVRLFLGKKIILDAGWSLFESSILSRKQYGIFGLKLVKVYLIDWISAHFATLVLVESNKQKNFYSKLFLVRRRKIRCIYTSIDEFQLNAGSNLIVPPVYFKGSKVVLFRGKYTKEAGIEVLVKCTHLLEKLPITFWVFSPGLPEKFIFSKNTYVNREYIQNHSDILEIYKGCTIALGQLSANLRLRRTIPHKAFEASYMGTPYLTARSAGIGEVFREGHEMVCFEPGNAMDLSNTIIDLVSDKQRLAQLSQNIREKYDSAFSSSILRSELVHLIDGFDIKK
jgi:glycosyltransferase involved in cell wall biosynthesis